MKIMKIGKVIEEKLIAHTLETSGFQEKRDYISMSAAYFSAEDIAKKFLEGDRATTEQKLKCYKGYQMEKDLVYRLCAEFGNRVSLRDRRIEAYNKIAGHVDFWFDGLPGDCKSVLKDEWIPARHKVPNKAYWQMQAYMLYSKKDLGIIVYESRETGIIKVFTIQQNKGVQERIAQKFGEVIALISAKINM